MDRYERAIAYYRSGCNCAQSVLAAFSDRTGLDEQTSFHVAGGFGGGACSGELCGAITGALMALGFLVPDETVVDPVEMKKQTAVLSRELQKRFREVFSHVRCQDLQKNAAAGEETIPPRAKAMGLTKHCDIMIVTAMEFVEEILAERK